MTFSCEIDAELKDFSGQAPIFPLPNVVLFPNGLLPLHIFEPRYRQMTADALEGERLIAMGLLYPGWETLPSQTKPPVHPIMGLGKIIAHEKLNDGRYNLVLRGLGRVKLLNEKNVDLPYRIGQFELCQEYFQESPTFDRKARAEKLASLFSQLFPKVQLQKLFLTAVSELPLRTVCDLLLGSIPLSPVQSQPLLDELDVDARSEMLLELLLSAVRGSPNSTNRKFPPEFSSN